MRVREYVLWKQLENRKQKNKTIIAGRNPKFRISALLVAHGSYHIATFIYRESYKNLNEAEMKKEIKKKSYSEDLRSKYIEGIEKLEHYVEDHKILREDLPKFFKTNPLVI